jgi:hypothetical protein
VGTVGSRGSLGFSGGLCRRIGREAIRYSTSAVTAHMIRTSISSMGLPHIRGTDPQQVRTVTVPRASVRGS